MYFLSLVTIYDSSYREPCQYQVEQTQPPHTCPVGEYGGEAGAHLGDRNKAFSPQGGRNYIGEGM